MNVLYQTTFISFLSYPELPSSPTPTKFTKISERLPTKIPHPSSSPVKYRHFLSDPLRTNTSEESNHLPHALSENPEIAGIVPIIESPVRI